MKTPLDVFLSHRLAAGLNHAGDEVFDTPEAVPDGERLGTSSNNKPPTWAAFLLPIESWVSPRTRYYPLCVAYRNAKKGNHE